MWVCCRFICRLCKSPDIQRATLTFYKVLRLNSSLLKFFLATLTTGFSKGPERPEFGNPIQTPGFHFAHSSFGELLQKCISKAVWDEKSQAFVPRVEVSIQRIVWYTALILSEEDAFPVLFSIFQCNPPQSVTKVAGRGRCSGFPPGIRCDHLTARVVSVSNLKTPTVVICKVSHSWCCSRGSLCLQHLCCLEDFLHHVALKA